MGNEIQINNAGAALPATAWGNRRAAESANAEPRTAATSVRRAEGPGNSPSPAEVQQLLQERLAGHDVGLRFEEKISAFVIEIKDHDSQEVVFQIPPEELVRLRERLQENMSGDGVLIDSTS